MGIPCLLFSFLTNSMPLLPISWISKPARYISLSSNFSISKVLPPQRANKFFFFIKVQVHDLCPIFVRKKMGLYYTIFLTVCKIQNQKNQDGGPLLLYILHKFVEKGTVVDHIIILGTQGHLGKQML